MLARRTLPTLTVAALALALAACGSVDQPDSPTTTAPTGTAVSISDAWVKAADSGMSAAFGELTNAGSTDVTVVAVSSPASSSLQLHETVMDESGAMVMQEKDGGFTIAAGDTLSLEPGGNHIMLMDLAEPLRAGDEVSFTLTFADDSTLEFTAPVKDYSGANENYDGGM